MRSASSPLSRRLLRHTSTQQQKDVALGALNRFIANTDALRRLAVAGGVGTLLKLVSQSASQEESDEIFELVQAVVSIDGTLFFSIILGTPCSPILGNSAHPSMLLRALPSHLLLAC